MRNQLSRENALTAVILADLDAFLTSVFFLGSAAVWNLRRRRSLMWAQGSSSARTLGTTQEFVKPWKGSAVGKRFQRSRVISIANPRVVATLQPLGC